MIHNAPDSPDVEVEIIVRVDGHRMNFAATRKRPYSPSVPPYGEPGYRATDTNFGVALVDATDQARRFIGAAYSTETPDA